MPRRKRPRWSRVIAGRVECGTCGWSAEDVGGAATGLAARHFDTHPSHSVSAYVTQVTEYSREYRIIRT